MGELLADTINAEQVQQAEGQSQNCYISELTMDGTTASVTYGTDTDAELVVGIYDEEQGLTKMLASGKTGVKAESTSATVKIVTDSMPQYYLVSAYLLNAETHEALCDSYVSNRYIKKIQDLDKATADDFDQELVLNLDDSKTTNFGVYNADTALSEEGGTANQIQDNGNGIYTVTNADDTFLKLAAGDTFSYTYADGDVLLVKAASVSVSGTTVTVTEDADAELTDFFDYMKIEAYGSDEPMTVDNSTMDEGLVDLGDTSAVSEAVSAQSVSADLFSDSAEDSVTAGDDFFTDSVGNEGEVHVAKYELNYAIDKQVGSDSNNVTIEGGFSLELDPAFEFYLAEGYQSLVFTVDTKASIKAEISGKLAIIRIPICKLSILLTGGVVVEVSPLLVLSAEGKIDWTGGFTARAGFEWNSNQGVCSRSITPKCTSEIKAEGRIYFGISGDPSVSLWHKDVLTAKLTLEAGAELKAEYEKNFEASEGDGGGSWGDEDYIHSCQKCLAGEINGKFEVKAEFKALKWEAEATLLDVSIKLYDLHYSFDYDEFGLTKCSHIFWRLDAAVLDQDGNPVAGVKVTASKDGTDYDLGTSSAQGNITTHLPEGTYTVSVEDTNSGTEYTARIDSKDQGGSSFTMGAAVKSIRIFLAVEKSYPLHAVVMDQTGNSLTGAKLSVSSTDGKKSDSGMTDSQGSVTVKLPAGNYVVSAADASGNSDYTVRIDNMSEENNIFAMESGEKEIKVYLIPKKVPLQVTARDKDGFIMEGVKVTVSSTDNQIYELGTTDEYGNITTKLPAGTYTVSVIDSSGSSDYTVRIDDSVDGSDTFILESQAREIYIYLISDNEEEEALASEIIGYWEFESVNQICTVSRNGILRISGSGEMVGIERGDIYLGTIVLIPNNPYHDWSYRLWHQLSYDGDPQSSEESVKKVIIEDGITTVSNFLNLFRNVEEVIIPESVEYIGEYAFSGCDKLKYIIIPEGVKSIGGRGEQYGDGAFSSCDSLTSVILKGGGNIAEDTFSSCTNLKNVSLEGVTTIGAGAFQVCENLKSITIPESVESIGLNAFWRSGLEDVTIGMHNIGEQAFYGCSNLKNVTLQESVKSIDDFVFGDCSSLTKIIIPASVEYIGVAVFVDCINLKEIYFTGNAPSLDSEAFNGINSESVIIYYPVNDDSWKKIDMQEIIGEITWKTYDPSTLKVSDFGENFDSVGVSDESFDLFSDGSESSEVTTETDSEGTAENTEGAENVDSESILEPETIVEPQSQETTDTSLEAEEIFTDMEIDTEPGTTITEIAAPISYASAANASSSGTTAMYQNLTPDTAYVFAALKDKSAQDPLAPSNLLYIAQKNADSNGAVSFTCQVDADAGSFSTILYGQQDTGTEPDASETNTVPDASKATLKLSVTAKKTYPLKVKQTFTVKVSGLAEGDSVASWKSSNKKVATVTKYGKITAKKTGTAKITVTLKSGKKAWIKVKVQKSAVKTKSLKVSNASTGKTIGKSVTLKRGKKLTLSTTVTPVTSKQKVTYKTSNKKIATVSSKGVITAGKKKGTATITVKSGSKTVKIKVTVK